MDTVSNIKIRRSIRNYKEDAIPHSPVSYTHLDVYKRQVSCSIFQYFKAVLWIYSGEYFKGRDQISVYEGNRGSAEAGDR